MAITGNDLLKRRRGSTNEDEKDNEKRSNNLSGEDLIKRRKAYQTANTDSVDQKYIDSFIKDANEFLSSAEKDHSGLGWGSASSAYESRNRTWQELNTRADNIGAWLYKNRNSIDQEAYANLSKSIEDIRSGGSSVVDAFKNSSDYYAQWDSEDAYNTWYADYTKKQEMASSEEGKRGWAKYLADVEAGKNALKHDLNNDGKEAWWEKALGYIGGGGGGIVDTTLPTAGVTQTIHDLREDDSYAKPRDDWSEAQKNIYGYLYMTSPAQAKQYAIDTNKQINIASEEEALKKIAESATSGFLAGAGHTLGSIATAPFGLADVLNDLAMSNAGIDIVPDGQISPFEYSQAVQGGISSHLNEKYGTIDSDVWMLGGIGLGDIYGLGTSIAQSMASAYTLGSAGTLVSYFGQGAASGIDDALSRGASEGQAVLYGVSLGVFEGLAEMIGIDNLFKLGSSSTLTGLIKNVLKQAGTEGAEEGLTSLFSNIADNVFMQDKSNFNFLVAQYMAQGMSEADAKKKAWMDSVGAIAFDTIAGAASGSVSGGIRTSIATRGYNNKAKELYGNGADLVTEALDINPDNAYAHKMQAKLDKGKSLTGGQINRLVDGNEQTLKTQDTAKMKSAVEGRLTELGETGDISKLADVIVKAQSGGKLTYAERSLLVNSKHGRRVSTELNPKSIESGVYTSQWAENIGTDRINTEAYNKGLDGLASEQAGIAVAEEEPSATKNPTAKEIATETKFEVSTDGITRVGDTEVSIKEIASVKDGEVTLRLEDGSTVSARDVEYGSSEEGLLYENVADMNLNAATANAFVKGYDPSLSVEQYALGFREAYLYGEYGFPVQEMSTKGFSSLLSESQKSLAYNLGKTDAKYKIEAKNANIAEKIASTSAIKAGKDSQKTSKKGKLHNTLTPTTERQRASLKTLGVVAEALGIDIYTFESPVVNGKRQGANGWFDPKDGSIHIDIHAGVNGEGTMLFTAAHELTHFIREWSPAKFKVFADFLLEQYGKKGVSVDALVNEQIAKAKRNGRSISYDTAYEEVIADSCEAMLADGDVVAKIAELKAKDKTLWQKIKDFITGLVERIKAAYEGMTPDSVEGRHVAEMLDTAERLKALWTEALVEASDNYTASIESAVSEVIEADAKPISSDEIITDGAVVTDGNGEKYSIRSMKHDISDGQMFRDLMNHCGFTKEQVGELRRQLEDLVDYMNPYRDIVDLNETYDREGRRYAPYKPNSDPLYTISLDFSTQCSKRLLTQYVIEQLQLRENRPMSPEEQMAIRDMLKEYGKVEKGLQVACVMCYVEAARLKAPKQIQKWLDDPATAMRNFFADKNPEFSKYIKEKQADFKESRGYDRDATKKEMSAKDIKALNQIRPRLRSQYNPSAEEMAIIETASSLPNSTYLTAGNLADLSETHPEIYKAYTAFIRTATRSKALETDEPYYYGDSTRDNGNGIIVSDSFIEAVNRENGMRFSSWSDWRIQHLLDWITAVIDNSVRGAAMHGYTKYGDEVRVLGKTGMMFNLSGVAGTQTGLNEDGSLSFSDTESIDIDDAIALREEFPETAGLQCIGVGIDHIYALLRSDVIDYVIPYHSSGLNATLRRMGDIYGWKDFTQTQHATEDKSIKKENAVDPDHWHQEPVFSEFFVGYDTGLGGVEAMRKSAENYKRMCRERGLNPKFLEFAKEPNYWKLLIDRKMVNQKTNTLIRQRAVTPTFDFGVIKGIVDKYVANYDSGLEQRAFNHIVENWDNIPKRIRDLKKQGSTKAKSTKKSIDKLANETVAVQPKEVKNSDRVSNKEEKYSDRILMGSLFSGGGTLEAGLAYQMLDKEFGVEYDGKIASVYADNHGDHIQVGRVEDFDISKYDDIFYLHASPVCHNFSKAKHGAKELQMDIDSAKATAKHLETAMPQVFTVENAPGYRKSQSLKIITDKLSELGYKWDVDVYNSADYGSATSRNRVILRAVKDGELPEKPSKQDRTNSWDKVTKDLWDTLPKSYLRPSFISAIENTKNLPILDANGKVNVNKPLLILTTTSGHMVTYCWEGEICPTLTTKCGEAKLVMPDGNIYAVTPEFMGRIQGLPDDYKYPKAKTRAFTIIGNGIPTHLTKAVVGGVLDSAYEQTHDGQVLYSDRYSEGLSEADKETADKVISGLKIRAQSARYGIHSSGTYTEERMDREIAYASSDTVLDYARSYITWVNPIDFIYATTTSENVRERLKEEAGNLDIERLRNERQPIHLIVNFETGEITGHEGRHRMLALQKAGVDRVAVVIDALNDNRHNTKPFEIMHLKGQKFGDYGRGADFFLHDVLPLSKRYAEVAKNMFSFESKGGVRFSDRPTESFSNRSLLANALESVAQNDIEKRNLEEYKGKIALIESEQAKLSEIRAKIRELSFAKGARDTEAIKKLQFEANQTANRINTYDKQLLNLESTKALKDVLQREKQMAYKRAEQRGKEALAAYRERATKTQRELMTRYQESRKKGIEGRRKTEMRHKIKDVVSELNQYLLKGTKDKHVPIELQKAVAEALDAVNMDTVGAEERLAEIHKKLQKDPLNPQLLESYRRIMEQGERMDGKLQALKNAYDEIVNSDDPLIANSHDEVISNSIAKVINEMGSTPLRDMTLTQLESVYDMYKMVLTTIRNTNKAFKVAKSEEISVIAGRVMEEIDGLGKKKLFATKASQAISKFDWNNLKPVYAFERIGSNTFTDVFNNVRAGEDTWAVDVTEAKDFALDQRKKFKYDSWDFKKRYGFTSSSGMNFELSLDQIMSLYAYSKREQAKDHLKKGGIVIDETTEVTIKNKLGIPIKFNPTQATAYNLSDETLADIIGKLTEEQRAFVDAMQDYLSTTMGDKGNEVSLALYGVKLYKEKNYFPLKSATQFMAKAKEQQKGEVKIKNSGFSKETTPKASNPIVLTPFMDVWADHVNEMSMYHAFVLPLEDFYRVYNYKTPTSDTMATESVEMYLQNAYGKGATQYIDQLLKDLNGGARVDSTAGIINKLTGLFKKSAVFASLSVVVQQPSAIARATALVDTKYFVGKPSGKHKATWAEVKKYAPVAVIKEMGYFDTGMGQSTVEWLKGDKTLRDKIDDAVSKAPALADEYAWCAIWNAVKRETLHTHKDLKPNSDEFLKAVGERFTEVITKTQVYDSVLARSANMRSKDTGMKMATAFMGEPTTSLNMLENAITQGKRGNKRYARRAIGGVVSSMILNSILVSLVYAGRDDDEDKTYAEKYVGTLTEELLDSINPLTLIPFVKDIVSIVQGYDVERSDMAVITDLVNAWNNLENDDRSAYRKVEDFAGAIASIFGLPVKNIMRDARGIYNTVNSFVNGEKTTGAGVKNAIVEAVTGDERSNGQQLYEAMLSGDTAQIDRVKGRFEDQKDIDSAIRKALRDNDPRIKQAAEARYNGNISEYMRIAKEIIAEGHFKQDDIVSAINSEINALKKGEGTTESSSSNKATSIYKVDDYYAAIVGRDQATAYVVKEDLIKTDIANGKDREEAEADFNSRFASYLRDQYEVGNISDYEVHNMLVTYGGKSSEDAYSKIQYWDFKKRYPDYDDLSEEAVKKFYSDVEPYGIGIGVYYNYSKQRAKCKGVDANGDGKTDSGTVKYEVMQVINSLPITYEQKDILYYLNGWSASTIWEAPWH